MAANLQHSSDGLDSLISRLEQDPPDVLLLLELSHHHFAQLAPALEPIYDHHRAEPADGVTGIGLWSALPVAGAEVEALVDGGWPAVRATLDVAGEPIQVVGIHPPPPASARSSRVQAAELETVARLPRDIPTIVMGDFNASREHAVMRDFLAETGLRDTHMQAGPLLPATWPSFLPLLHIDHILVTDEFAIEGATIPNLRWGGDHRAVAAELSVAR